MSQHLDTSDLGWPPVEKSYFGIFSSQLEREISLAINATLAVGIRSFVCCIQNGGSLPLITNSSRESWKSGRDFPPFCSVWSFLYDAFQWQLSFQEQMATQEGRLSSLILKTLCIFLMKQVASLMAWHSDAFCSKHNAPIISLHFVWQDR